MPAPGRRLDALVLATVALSALDRESPALTLAAVLECVGQQATAEALERDATWRS